MQGLGRVVALDGVRGVAVLLVLVFHLTAEFFSIPGYVPTAPSWAIGGFLGVDLFFVLSGFLVSSLVLDEIARSGGRPMWGQFYRRRSVRLVPALAAFAAVHVVFALVAGLSIRDEAGSLALIGTGLTNWLGEIPAVTLNDGLIHLWSLALEWQYYLVFPILVAIAAHRRRSSVAVAVLLGAGVVTLWRAHLYATGVPIPLLYIRTDTRADSILVGVALAYGWPVVRGLPTVVIGIAGWIGLVVLATVVLEVQTTTPFLYQGGFALVAVAGAAVVAAVTAGTGPARWFELRPLVAVGRVSYGLYIWHVLIIRGVSRWGASWPSGAQVIVSLAITGFATLVSWRLIEQPISRRFGRSARSHGPTFAPGR